MLDRQVLEKYLREELGGKISGGSAGVQGRIIVK